MTPVAALFHEGPLRARVAEIGGFQIAIHMRVPPQLQVRCDDTRQSALSHCAIEGRSRGIFLLSRHLLESVAVTLEAGIPPAMPMGRLFRKGPIELHVIELKGRNVGFGVRAPRMLHIHRREVPERIRKDCAPRCAGDMERPLRVAPSVCGLMQEIPRELLIGTPSPPSIPGAWMRRTPPDL
jgi:sRNA-binding carbon storage regulator CsrA